MIEWVVMRCADLPLRTNFIRIVQPLLRYLTVIQIFMVPRGYIMVYFLSFKDEVEAFLNSIDCSRLHRHPGGYPRRPESTATGLGCRNLLVEMYIHYVLKQIKPSVIITGYVPKYSVIRHLESLTSTPLSLLTMHLPCVFLLCHVSSLQIVFTSSFRQNCVL